jgi:hypothetical protein
MDTKPTTRLEWLTVLCCLGIFVGVVLAFIEIFPTFRSSAGTTSIVSPNVAQVFVDVFSIASLIAGGIFLFWLGQMIFERGPWKVPDSPNSLVASAGAERSKSSSGSVAQDNTIFSRSVRVPTADCLDLPLALEAGDRIEGTATEGNQGVFDWYFVDDAQQDECIRTIQASLRSLSGPRGHGSNQKISVMATHSGDWHIILTGGAGSVAKVVRLVLRRIPHR